MNHISVNKKVLTNIIPFLIFMTLTIAVSAQDYLALQGSAAGTGPGIGAGTGQGNITVEIWGAATGGSLLYNSSSDFRSALNNSRYDILLGNSSQPLSLNFSNTYYMELYINERELDFNGTERQVFQSSVGNITVTTPIKTTNSLNVNDFFNVTASTSAMRTNGTVTILNADTNDALNVTGGLKIGQQAGSMFTLSSFTISDMGVITTDPLIGPATGRGHIIINSLTEPALQINSGFNVSGATGALRTNGSIAILSTDNDDALNVSNGLRAGGPFRVGDSGTPAFGVGHAGLALVTITSPDADDALNVTGSIAQQGAVITIGNAESTKQHNLQVFDGGTDKCAYIRLYDDGGGDWFLFANTTGQLRMFGDAPTGIGQCNTGGNGVGGQPN